jgi:hypothetical protein
MRGTSEAILQLDYCLPPAWEIASVEKRSLAMTVRSMHNRQYLPSLFVTRDNTSFVVSIARC